MKFLIFTCLLAVAFAKHITRNDINEMEYANRATGEEYDAESTQKDKFTVEEKNYLKQLDQAKQFYQKLNLPQYLQAIYQQKMMNKYDQTKTGACLFTPLNKDQISTDEETIKKTVDMESSEEFSEKIELTEEQKNYMKFLHTMNQYYQKLAFLQYLRTFPQYQTTMYPWTHNMINAYQQFPYWV